MSLTPTVTPTPGPTPTPFAEAVDITGFWTINFDFGFVCGYEIIQTATNLEWTGDCLGSESLTGTIELFTGNFSVTGPDTFCDSFGLKGIATIPLT